MRRALLAGPLLAGPLLAAAVAVPAHGATWSPGAEIVSVDNARLEQGDGPVRSLDMTPDGRYVVFQTLASNFFRDDDPDPAGVERRGGIFRYDRQTGALDLVADGDFISDSSPTREVVLRGAAAPSISADGSKVAFSTAQRLVPADRNDNVDVYVRDMGVALRADRAASGAYVLASARDGGDVPARYAPRNPPLPAGEPGSAVWPATALSDDGRYVAFRTTEQASDLPDRAGTDTPPGAVFVRDLATARTVAVSRRLSDGAPVGDAQAPVVLSPDGSTVAWVSVNAQDQTRLLGNEVAGPSTQYLLWRRWGDLGARTRRITGQADLDDPGCADASLVGGPTDTGPCLGPLTEQEQAGFADLGRTPPALSADGYTVAFVAAAGPRPSADNTSGPDAFVTDMRPGVSRKAGTTVLTRDAAGGSGASNAAVESVDITRDGRRVALTTARTVFLPPAPPLVDPVRSSSGVTDLYVADRGLGRLERVSFTAAGGDPASGIDPYPVLSADGRSVAFSTRSGDLITGDANQAADAFVATVAPPPPPAPPLTALTVRPRDSTATQDDVPELSVRTQRLSDGRLRLRVKAPLIGRLTATARTGTGRRARRVTRRTVEIKKARTLTVTLKPGKSFAKALRTKRGVRATLTVQLVPATGETLEDERDVVFRRAVKKPRRGR
jgi:Tol biopolymer transport system component